MRIDLFGALGILAVGALFTPPAAAAVTVTISNSDALGNQLSRFDVDGNSLDAHDGTLVLFGSTYYLYGTSYACGYEYRQNSKFCGFKVYSSTDLVHFQDRGFVVPAADCQYCFRPHVIFNAATSTYVMWSDSGGGTYHVHTSASPTGPFAQRPNPTLAVGGAVDEALFVDDDATGYLIHNTTQVASGLIADMVVEKLTPDYLNTTGASVRLGLGDVEAFTVFKRAGVYHALMSDPTCAYCSGATGEMTSTSMLGPWSGAWDDPNGMNQNGGTEPRKRARIVNSDNCGGQPLATLPVPQKDGSLAYYFISDRWNNRTPNESLANFFIGPMAFDPSGVLSTIDCVKSFSAELAIGAPGSYKLSPQEDQSSGFDGFRHYCDIQGHVQRQQSFTPSVTSTLVAASVTTFQSGSPNAPLFVDVVDASGTVLHTESVAAASVPWAPHVVTIHPSIAVTAGHSYALRLRSAATSGCYGFEYNDANAYAGGFESYSTNDGTSFTSEPTRDLKFTVDVDRPDAGDAGNPGDGGDADEAVRPADANANEDRHANDVETDASGARDAGLIVEAATEERDADSSREGGDTRDVPASSNGGCSCHTGRSSLPGNVLACLAVLVTVLYGRRRAVSRGTWAIAALLGTAGAGGCEDGVESAPGTDGGHDAAWTADAPSEETGREATTDDALETEGNVFAAEAGDAALEPDVTNDSGDAVSERPVVADAGPFATTITNFNAKGGQITRFDTSGDAVDAHDGKIAFFEGNYYLYGTSYGCGYQWNVPGSPFCGMKAYSSTDLVHWTDRGFLFDATTATWQSRCNGSTYGCYRPHVVRNAATGLYVLWINVYDNSAGFRVFTAASPAGPFTEAAVPTLAVNAGAPAPGLNNGDEDVFIDDDGTAYVAFTDWRTNGRIAIEKLDAKYLSGSGAYVAAVTPGSTEAPALFKRNGVYYLTYSDPNCGYCAGTGTSYRTAQSPLGPWSPGRKFTNDSCGGQPSFVAPIASPGGSTFLYGSDLWNNAAKNEALANFFWAPLSFAADGSIDALACSHTAALTLSVGVPGSQEPAPPNLEDDSGVDGFTWYCDIHAAIQRSQSFVAKRTGMLTSASFTTFKSGNPDSGLELAILRATDSSLPTGAALSSVTVSASAIDWHPREVRFQPNVPVQAGVRYTIVAKSTATVGCYGVEYSDAAPYPGGGAAYSASGGTTFAAEMDRTLKFRTFVQ